MKYMVYHVGLIARI